MPYATRAWRMNTRTQERTTPYGQRSPPLQRKNLRRCNVFTSIARTFSWAFGTLKDVGKDGEVNLVQSFGVTCEAMGLDSADPLLQLLRRSGAEVAGFGQLDETMQRRVPKELVGTEKQRIDREEKGKTGRRALENASICSTRTFFIFFQRYLPNSSARNVRAFWRLWLCRKFGRIEIELSKMVSASKPCLVLLVLSRKLAMLAGVPLALARNMPGAGFANSLILSDLTPPPPPLPPWRLVTLRSRVQPPLRPSSQKQLYLQCFLL